MGKFDGKKLLELGTSVASVDIVKYAKSEGAYVIVTDYLPAEKSEAKQYADEMAMISTLDVDALTEFAREKKVDGVFCGVSEANLLSVRAVTERLGLPCYFTMEQWELVQDKERFKELCEKFGVPVPKKYCLSAEPTRDELDAVKYPVIVKPVDQGAGIGIHVCHNEEELLAGYEEAYAKSNCHRVIVEEYLTGREFHANYTFCNGEFSLSTYSEKWVNPNGWPEIPIATDAFTIIPHRRIDEFLATVNDRFIAAMRSIGLENGVLFIQGIRTKDGPHVFEAGLRLNGGASYLMIHHVNGIDRIAGMVSYALTGKMDIDLSLDDPTFHGKKAAYLSLLCHHGTVGAVQGVEEVQRLPGVIATRVFYHVGDEIPVGVPLRHRFIQLYIVEDTIEELLDTIEKVNNTVKVWDAAGNDMIIQPLDPKACYFGE